MGHAAVTAGPGDGSAASPRASAPVCDSGAFEAGSQPAGLDITVTPGVARFGRVAVGQRADVVLTITNIGAVDVTIGAIRRGGTDRAHFKKPRRLDGCSGQTLGPGESCTVGLRFKPQSKGRKQAALVVPSTDPDEGSVTVTLRGRGTR